MDALDLRQRTIDIINCDRAELLRAQADTGNVFCFVASLYETKAALEPATLIPRPAQALGLFRQELGDSTTRGVLPNDLWQTLNRSCNLLGLGVEKITGNPSFIEQLGKPPIEFDNKINPTTGPAIDIATPNLRILAQRSPQDEGDVFTHAESDLGTDRTFNRITRLKEAGWKDALVIEFSPTM